MLSVVYSGEAEGVKHLLIRCETWDRERKELTESLLARLGMYCRN